MPDYFEGWFNLGLAHQKSGKQAADAYTESIRVRQQAYTNLGIVRQEMGDTKGAKEAYEQAFKLNANATAPPSENPEFPEALLNLGHVLKSMGQEQEARICWSKALEARPELAQGYFETAK